MLDKHKQLQTSKLASLHTSETNVVLTDPLTLNESKNQNLLIKISSSELVYLPALQVRELLRYEYFNENEK